MTISTRQPTSYRPHAAFLVGASAGVLLFISAVLQVLAWELSGLYRSRGLSLSALPEEFLDTFGHRPDAYLIAVVFWFWWPKVAALIYCHQRYREPQEFAVAFLYWFLCCWLLTALALSFMVFLCVWPILTLLLADLEGTPDHVWVLSAVSWLLPLGVVVFALAWRLRFRRGSDKPG